MLAVLALTGIFAFATFAQTVAGFGFALIAMPLLALGGVPLTMAAPLVALVGLLLRPILLTHYWRSLRWGQVWRLGLASLLGVPLGVHALAALDGRLVTAIFGVVVTAYAIFALWEFYIPPMRHPLWTLGLGFVAGVMGGAYNIPGPSAVIYGIGRRWLSAEFKANLQAFTLFNSVTVTLAHAAANHLTPWVLGWFLFTLPAILLGFFLGAQLDERIPQGAFRRLVLFLLLLTGLSLVL